MKNIFNKNIIIKKIFLTFLIFFTFFSPVIKSEIIGIGGNGIIFAAAAQDCKEGEKRDSTNKKCVEMSKLEVQASKFQQSIVSLMLAILTPVTLLTLWTVNLIPYLLNPTTVFDPSIVPTLKQYRILLKNIILTLSVFILIGIALKNLFKEQSLGSLGGNVGKFAVTLVLIHFSWFAVKFVIDIGAISTRAAFTLYEDFGKNAQFTKFGYKIDGMPIINWRPDSNEYEDTQAGYTNTVCFLYEDNSNNKGGKTNGCRNLSGKTRCIADDIHCQYIKYKDDNKNKEYEIKEDELYPKNSKVIVRLKKIKPDSAPDSNINYPLYDLPSAIMVNFIPTQEFYKISAGVKDWQTLIVETLFSAGLALVTVFSILSIIIILLQRVAFLWFFLVSSPLYFFEYLLGLLGVGKFFSDKFTVSNLLSQAIFVPMGFGILYVGIAILGGELFYGDLLESGMAAAAGNGEGSKAGIGSIYKLIIGGGVVYGMWKGTSVIASKAGGLGKSVVEASMNGISSISGKIAGNTVMNSKLFSVGGGGGNDTSKASLNDIKSEALNKMKALGMTDYQKEQNGIIDKKSAFKGSKKGSVNLEIKESLKLTKSNEYEKQMQQNAFKTEDEKAIFKDYVDYIETLRDPSEFRKNNIAVKQFIKVLTEKGLTKQQIALSGAHAVNVYGKNGAKNISPAQNREIIKKLIRGNEILNFFDKSAISFNVSETKALEIDPLAKRLHNNGLNRTQINDLIKDLTESGLSEDKYGIKVDKASNIDELKTKLGEGELTDAKIRIIIDKLRTTHN